MNDNELDPKELIGKKKTIAYWRAKYDRGLHGDEFNFVGFEVETEEVDVVYRETGGPEQFEYMPQRIDQGMLMPETPHTTKLREEKGIPREDVSLEAGLNYTPINHEATEVVAIVLANLADDSWWKKEK